ncbi:hypothetical protein DAMNIGENAA_31740 [Desulforhabdus amnigena]|uniref:Uncharacterized protein n=1 Tax=Desulforhabdus amnigena TaxID=40218 RepID=A0A9W6FVN2_9BACT|nr:hypothetical protein DAMNIGENAA_31740 [Desulforhabdus amnigena]
MNVGAAEDRFSAAFMDQALFLVDKEGIVHYIDLHEINEKPNIEEPVREMENLPKRWSDTGRRVNFRRKFKWPKNKGIK